MELSSRESEILILIAQGFLDKEIAIELQISTRTVQTHVIRICSKLDARNRTHAVTKLLLKIFNCERKRKHSLKILI